MFALYWGYVYTILRLCLHYNGAMFTLYWGYVYTILDSFSGRHEYLSGVVWTASFRCVWPRGFGPLNPDLTPEYLLPCIPVLFTFSTVQIPDHTTPQCCTERIQCVTLHFRDWRGEPRSSTEIARKSSLLCVNRNLFQYGFLAGARAECHSIRIAWFSCWLVGKLYAQLGDPETL